MTATRHVLHDREPVEKRALLRKACEALPAGGALIVYEALVDGGRSEKAPGLPVSLSVHIGTPGGFDFTRAYRSRRTREAGFGGTRVGHLVGPDSMVVGIR